MPAAYLRPDRLTSFFSSPRRSNFQLSHNSLVGTLPTEIRTMGSHVPPDESALALEDLPAGVYEQFLSNASAPFYTPSSELTSTMGLQQFDVSYNQLNGTIPTTIADVSAEDVDPPHPFCPCRFEATHTAWIPSQYGRLRARHVCPPQLVNLQALDISHNPALGDDGCCNETDSYYQSFYSYQHTLPTEIGLLKKLQVTLT